MVVNVEYPRTENCICETDNIMEEKAAFVEQISWKRRAAFVERIASIMEQMAVIVEKIASIID